MTNAENDCYLHIRRNPFVKQIDLSGSTGKCRQLAGYRNILSDETAFVCNDCRQTEFLDWLLNLEDNCFTYSTLPCIRLQEKYWVAVINLSGIRWAPSYRFENDEGEYEIEVDEISICRQNTMCRAS